MLRGKELIADIDAARVQEGEACFWWIGQQSFVVKTSRTVIYLDPYLSDSPSRRVKPLLAPSDVTNADVITGSHDHIDHIDRPVLVSMMQNSPSAILVVPRAVFPGLTELDLEPARVRGIDDGESEDVNDAKVTAIKAAHEFFDRHEQNGYPYLGYVLESGGVTIYHAGDTCVWEGLASRTAAWNITIAFLPINGRDGRRLRSGCLGNMTYQEAVDLAGTVRPKLVVPAHYEMFASNSEDPSLFADYMDVKYPNQKYWIGTHGECVRVSAG